MPQDQKTSLKYYNYKSKYLRSMEGLGQNGWWFTGGTSFMSNGYVIYAQGLDGNLPNPTALRQGSEYRARMFDYRATSMKASYGQFTSQLYTMWEKAKEKEEKYLKLKLQALDETIIDVDYKAKIKEAIEKWDYGSAFTLLTQRDKDLEKIRSELNSKRNRSVTKTKDFYNSQFSKYIQDIFTQQISQQSGASQLNISLDTDFEQVVDNYLNTMINEDILKNYGAIDGIRQTFIDGLKKLADKNNGVINFTIPLMAQTQEVELAGQKIKASNFIRKDGKFRTPGVIARKLTDSFFESIGRGLSEEIRVAASQGITHAFTTGSITKQIKNEFTNEVKTVSQKGDVLSFEVFNAGFTVEDVIDEVLKTKGITKYSKEYYEKIEEVMKQKAEETASGEFFTIATNVKGYKSNMNLQIEGENSFSWRMSNLKKIRLDGNMVNKLIFMLNNTTKGCIADRRVSELQDYFAAICVAWMWDNYEEIFDIDLEEPLNYNRIYLFSSGGAYLTSSQILLQTMERLSDYQNPLNNKFVQVNITPPEPYDDYTNLCAKYPVHNGMTSSVWQETLKKRWDEVKEKAMESGKIGIDFDQKQLEELVGNLKTIINQQ